MRGWVVDDLVGGLLVVAAYVAVGKLVGINTIMQSYRPICVNDFGQHVPCGGAVAPLAQLAAVLLVTGLVLAQRRSARA